MNKYEKLQLIGKGSFATIWKVRHEKYGYIRALKVSNEMVEDENDPAYISFLNECKVLLKIGNGSHPNIVHIYQPDLIENRAVVEMDYVDGVTMERYIARKKFIEMDEVHRFFREIVGALAYCHHDIYRFLMDPNVDNLVPDPNDGSNYLIDAETERRLAKKYGVTHNDIHSNNVMRRNYDGNFILLDFGLAIQDGKAVKSSSRRGGALEYMSPEKFEDSGTITTESDVYSLGILLYEVLAGRVPFVMDASRFSSNPTVAQYEMMNAHKTAIPPAIEPLRREAFEKAHPGETYVKDYPDWLEEIIMKCLEKNPVNRFADAKELLDEYKAMMASGNNASTSHKASGIPTPPPVFPVNDGDSDEEKPFDNNDQSDNGPVTHPPLPIVDDEDEQTQPDDTGTNTEPSFVDDSSHNGGRKSSTPPPLPFMDDTAKPTPPPLPTNGTSRKTPPPQPKPTPRPVPPQPKKRKSHAVVIFLVILLLALFSVIGYFVYEWYEDSQYPKYYTYATSLNLRSSQNSKTKSNIIEALPYGTKLSLINYGKYWSEVKTKTSMGKQTGYVSSDYILEEGDFFLLDGIFGNDNAREMISEQRCRKALLDYFRENRLRGELTDEGYKADGRDRFSDNREMWQVMCYSPSSKYNSVYYCKEYNKNSKYKDFVVIIQKQENGFTTAKRLLYFHFDDTGKAYKVYEDNNPASDRIQNVSTYDSWFSGEKNVLITYC